jgi:photosystem II stability/assembly factor-like uncharacterized protein
MSSPSPVDFLNKIAFSDRLHGWAVGVNGVILSTSNGGRTWARQVSEWGLDLWGVAFADASRGWVTGAGTPGLVLSTSDGGRAWKPLVVRDLGKDFAGFTDIHFMDTSHGWAVGDLGVIVATSNGGHSWKKQRSGTKAPLAGAAFIGGSRG